MTKMRISLLLSTLFFAQIAFAQDTYYKSSMVTLKNDTIQGFISNLYDSKSILFKKKKNDKATFYTPRTLRGFTLDGNVFETKIINVPYYKKDATSLTDAERRISKDKERGRITDTVFLHKLVYGTVSLFKMNNLDGFTYFFAQKAGVLRELPPQYCETWTDSSAVTRMVNMHNNGIPITNNIVSYIHIKDDYLDTLGLLLNDRRYVTLPSKTFTYSEKSLSEYVARYNKAKGIANGGLLKSKVSRKIFTGINAGLVTVQYDDLVENTQIGNSLAFKLYGLYPLSGTNRNIFAKFGVNYFTYRNDYYKKSIPSASFGLRYSAISGPFRPYFDGSIAIASMNKNNRPTNFGFPFILEFGANIPVKNHFLTIGASHSPVMVYQLNGYKFWAFNIGMMF
jgi:hypothetical protein